MRPILGIIFLVAISWILSENKKLFNPKSLIIGLSLQFAIALIFFKLQIFQKLFLYLNKIVEIIDKATTEGTSFVFGFLGGAELPFSETYPGSSFILAFFKLLSNIFRSD